MVRPRRRGRTGVWRTIACAAGIAAAVAGAAACEALVGIEEVSVTGGTGGGADAGGADAGCDDAADACAPDAAADAGP